MEGWDPQEYGQRSNSAQKAETQSFRLTDATKQNRNAQKSGNFAWQQSRHDNIISGQIQDQRIACHDNGVHPNHYNPVKAATLNSLSTATFYPSPVWDPAHARWLARRNQRQNQSKYTAPLILPSQKTSQPVQNLLNSATEEKPLPSEVLQNTDQNSMSEIRETAVHGSASNLVVPDQKDVLGSIEERIKDAREKSLRKIATRDRKNDKHCTVSLQDLDLARKPVDPLRPRASRRPWMQEIEFDEHVEVPNQRDDEKIWQYPPTQIQLANDVPSNFWQSSSINHTQNSRHENPGPKPSRWAAKEDMRVEVHQMTNQSNAWGSEIPSDATKESHRLDNVYGKLLQNEEAFESDTPLADWEGKMIPPPADWTDRPRYNNNNENYKDWFIQWKDNISHLTLREDCFDNGVPYVNVSAEKMQDLDLCPDGIGYVRKLQTINIHNAAYYGYTDDPKDATKYANALKLQDFDDWGKLDPTSPSNWRFKDETTEGLVSNWLQHLENEERSRNAVEDQRFFGSSRPELKTQTLANTTPSRPKLNVYLRPAVAADIPELTRIYNWHVENGPRTSEVYKISEDDMRLRLDCSKSSKLPFIVAAKKAQKHSIAVDLEAEAQAFRHSHSSRQVQNVQRKHRAVTRIEHLAGWVSAEDLTAADYAEHISVEIELYVDSEYRRMGVAHCLMDKILEACDRGYLPLGGYQFHCAQKLQHLYNGGGGRNLHKTFIILRKWKYTKVTSHSRDSKKYMNSNIADEEEGDEEKWLKQWLESWGFQVEGTLIGIGAKNGRYIDAMYLGRETQWRPEEGQLPNPFPRVENNIGDDESNNNEDAQ